MKKLVLGITLSALALLIAIVIISQTKNVSDMDIFYTIPRILTYRYEPEKRMSFEIFINNENNLIEFPEENTYYLIDRKSSYQLREVEVSKEKNSISKEEIFYKYTVTCTILNFSEEDMIFPECFLKIKNDAFTLESLIGYVAIYKKNYAPLDFKDLYGNYAYIEGELHFIGLTIQLGEDYTTLSKVQIGSAFVNLDKIEADILYDSERLEGSLKHSILNENPQKGSFKLKAKQNYYFWPVSYPNLALFTSGCILVEVDDKICYIEDFTYLANDISIANYNHIRKEGKVTYA